MRLCTCLCGQVLVLTFKPVATCRRCAIVLLGMLVDVFWTLPGHLGVLEAWVGRGVGRPHSLQGEAFRTSQD